MLLFAYTAVTSRVAVLRARADRGATAVEYGLLAALIAAVIVATVLSLGGKINTAFQKITDLLP
ncbi:Flp family type IVb pilin [Cryptosporangium phraense]|uniref:Flp family type IVb pilin n=2 Tax=Cryptosporangium phraense TaxID=2593070 RepID=A0A545AHF5_9ACTN|nr:Flp family type IVb pilin [Cryptosporangium phraense]